MTDTILTPNKFALIVENIVKDKKDYLPLLKPAIEEFHKKFKENGKTN